MNCASCHSGTAFTRSGANTLVNIGTLKPTSGQRLFGTLTGIDVPTLRDVWASAPYLHDGSAPTLEDAVRAHSRRDRRRRDLHQAGRLPARDRRRRAGAGVGKRGHRHRAWRQLLQQHALAGTPVLTRIEAVDFDWGGGSPGTGRDVRQLLGALDRHGARAEHRHLSLPDRVRRRRAPVGQRRAARQQLDRPRPDARHQRRHQPRRRPAARAGGRAGRSGFRLARARLRGAPPPEPEDRERRHEPATNESAAGVASEIRVPVVSSVSLERDRREVGRRRSTERELPATLRLGGRAHPWRLLPPRRAPPCPPERPRSQYDPAAG